jgi:cytochrome oxidase assembly protein ShyY1
MMFPVVKKPLIKTIKQQWQLSLLVLLFLPLLLRLGFWQAERAEEKQQLLAVYQQQQNLPAKNFTELANNNSDVSYRPVIITGTYDKDRYWLLDNKPRQGKVGYEVIMPLQVDTLVYKELGKEASKKSNSQTILVNRGWIKAPRLRSDFPLVEAPSEKVTIKGYFYIPSKNAIFRNIDNSSSDLSQAWPKRVLALRTKQAKAVLATTVYPQVLRINDESPSALITEWPVINTLPEKHYGYSVQWFAMALALVCLYAWAIIKKPEE